MSAAFDRQTDEWGHCENIDCKRSTTSLTLLGKRNLCDQCYRIAIADLDVKEPKPLKYFDPFMDCGE